MKKIIIAGGSGFLGKILASNLSNSSNHVVILSRKKQKDSLNIHHVTWNAETIGLWANELEGADVLINLTGKSVDCRYTKANKQEIYNSRLNATHILGEAIKGLKNPPKLWINAASATIYRHALDKEMDEETGEMGTGFSVDVCQKWEQMFNDADTPHTRKIILRIGIVLGKNGGALAPLKRLVQLGVGGHQGLGNQYFSWLHEKDFVDIVQFLIENEHLSGVYNATAPHPITNKELMKDLRKVMHMPFGLSMPRWLLTLGAFIIRTETELIFKSRRVVPRKLIEAGYNFQFSNIRLALDGLIKKQIIND